MCAAVGFRVGVRGATTLLVASGIAAPGPPLAGLVIGIAIVLAAAPLLARIPGERDDTADLAGPETPPMG